jgi:hypothetical protein
MTTLTQAIFRGQSRKGETDYAAVYLKKKELKTRQNSQLKWRLTVRTLTKRYWALFPKSSVLPKSVK